MEQNPGGQRRARMAWAGGKAPARSGPADGVGNEPRGPVHDCASSGAVGSGTAEPPQG